MNKTFEIGAIMLAILLASASAIPLTSQAADDKPVADAVAPAPVYTAAETKDFKALAQATLAELAAGNQTGMVAKLTDLETAWDDQEKSLRPKDEATWTALDKMLDKAISALRSSHVNRERGKTALADLVKKLEQATKP